MQDAEILGILSVKCSIKEPRGYVREINEHRIEDKSCTNSNLNINQMVTYKDKPKIRLFPCGPERNIDMKAGTECTKAVHNEF